MQNRYKNYIELIYLLVAKELKLKYKQSYFGYIWAIINPITFALVYWIAFKFIMKINIENYSIYLLTGLFPWIWVSQSIIQGAGSYINNSSLIKKINIPHLILPMCSVIMEMINYIFSIPVLILFLMLFDLKLISSSQIWMIPLMLFLQLVFIYPITLIVALLNVYYRDIQYLVTILFSIIFFLTPIVYQVNMIDESFQVYFKINPIYWLIETWRSVFLEGIITLKQISIILIWSVSFSLIAYYLYKKLSPSIAEEL